MTRKTPLAVLLVAVIAIVVVATRSANQGARDLAALIDRADRLVVRAKGYEGAEVLFETTDRRDFEELKTSLRVTPPQKGSELQVHRGAGGLPLRQG